MEMYYSQLDQQPQDQNQQQRQQSLAYEFPIGNKGKKSEFVAEHHHEAHDIDNDLGEPSPVYLKNGPRQDRRCRDFVCLIVFLFFIFYYTLVFFEMALGDFQYERFSIPHDPDHHPCRYGHKFIYFVSPDSDHLDRTVCINECPKDLPQDLTGYKLDCLPNSVIKDCTYSPTKDINNQFLIYNTTQCNRLNRSDFLIILNIYKSDLNHVCLPTDTHLFEQVYPALSINKIYFQVGNIQQFLKVIIFSAFLSFILGCIFFGFLGYCGDLLTWFFIFSFVIFMGVLGCACFFRGTSGQIPLVESADNSEEVQIIDQRIKGLRDFEVYFLVATAICWIVSLTTLGLVIYYHRKIKIIASQLKISAHFILQNKLILLAPFVLFIILLCFFIFWVYLCVQIIGNEVDSTNAKSRLPFDQFEVTNGQIFKLLINLAFILIFRGFLVGCSDFLITSACSIWYYKKEKDNTNTFLLLRYHLGSIIFLGTVNTLLDYPIRLSNVICDYLTKITKKERNSYSYYFASIALCGCICFDKLLRYMNRYALIFIALAGDNYYGSSKQSYYLLKRNNRRFQLVRNLGGAFFTLSKLFLALLSSFLCYCFVISIPHYYQKAPDLLAPTLAFFALSYTTASFFIDVYSETSTSVILISYIDEEVEKYHYGKEDAFNCPPIIRGNLTSIRNARI